MTARKLRADGGNLLSALPELDGEGQRRRHTRLIAASMVAGVTDVAYRTLDTPVGALLLAATEKGLVRVAYACEDHDTVVEKLTNCIGPRTLRAPARLDRPARQIEEYFAGRRRVFDLPLDFQLSRGFRRTVLFHLTEIGYGRTASYAAIAAAAGNPKAVRAVGSSCATNPLPIIVPCHRVVRSDGTVGQYAGGTEAKRALLALEAAAYGVPVGASANSGALVPGSRFGTGTDNVLAPAKLRPLDSPRGLQAHDLLTRAGGVDEHARRSGQEPSEKT